MTVAVPQTTIIAHRLFDGAMWHDNCAVSFVDGVISEVRPCDRRFTVDQLTTTLVLPDDVVLVPGFVDLQVNGGGGVLFNDQPSAEGARALVAAHRKFGTTGLLPTLITDAPHKLAWLAAAAAEIGRVPGVLGVHLEGPFLNPRRKGVHPAEWLRAPTGGDLAAIQAIASQLPLMVTLAPECVPQGFIAGLVRMGVRVAIGHSDATAGQVAAALDEGATGVTHLFNAMSQLQPREPGVVGATFDDTRIIAGVIADGIHVAPANLRVAFRLLGRDRLALVTDAMPSVGVDRATFELHGRQIRLAGGRLTAPDGTLAGAHLTMIDAVRNATTWMGASFEDACIMASVTPARFLGLRVGMIQPGYPADVIALNAHLNLHGSWLGGSAD